MQNSTTSLNRYIIIIVIIIIIIIIIILFISISIIIDTASTGRAGVRWLIYSSAVKAFLLVLWYLEVLLLWPRRKEKIKELAVINRLQFLCSRFEFCVIF